MKGSRLILVLSVSLFVSLSLFQAQDIDIKIENGVPVVHNPKNPVPRAGGPKRILLKEDLCIGVEEGAEGYMFSQIRSVQVDEEENIYVLDTKEVCVKVFDKGGKHLRTFGNKGQGPGELQYPYRMYLTPGNEILIYDPANSRLSFFSCAGECLREVSIGKYRFTRTIPDSQGNIITHHLIPGDQIVNEITKYDGNLNPLFTINTFEEKISPAVINLLRPNLNVRVMKNDNIVWGYPLKYEIFISDPEGKTLRKIVKDYDPVKIGEEDKKKMIKDAVGDRGIPPGYKFEFPKDYYPYYFFICGDEGRIYVRTYEKDKDGNFRYDVFDPEGRCIATFFLPEIDYLYVAKKDRLYSMVWEDEKGIPVVKRYSVTWEY